jgi:hypothetical protein
MEKRKMVIFDQFVGKWKKDEQTFMVVYYLNADDMELRKLFIERDEFISKNVKSLFTKQLEAIKLLEGTFELDGEDHERLTNLEVTRFGKVVLDKELP